jgi:hypothetical protein
MVRDLARDICARVAPIDLSRGLTITVVLDEEPE